MITRRRLQRKQTEEERKREKERIEIFGRRGREGVLWREIFVV